MSARFLGGLLCSIFFCATALAEAQPGDAKSGDAKPAHAAPAYPSPEWAKFRESIDLKKLQLFAALDRGRFRPVDTAAREMMRVMMENREQMVLRHPKSPEQMKGLVAQLWGKPYTEETEPAALTLWGIALAPRHYYDAPLVAVVSTPLRRELFVARWAHIDQQSDKAAYEAERLKWIAVDRYFTYREVLTNLVDVYNRRTQTMEAAAKAGSSEAPRPGAIAARSEKGSRFAAEVAKLDTLNSKRRGEIHKELLSDLKEAVGADGAIKDSDRRNILSHMDSLQTKLDTFDNAAHFLRSIPISTDPQDDWLAPEGMLIVLARWNKWPSANAAPEEIEVAAGKFALPDRFEQMDEQGVREVLTRWAQLRKAFLAADVEKANTLIVELSDILRNTHETVHLGKGKLPLYHPTDRMLGAEVYYNGMGKFVWVWGLFLLSALVLSGAMIFRSKWMLIPGLTLFAGSFLVMVVHFGFRLFLAQRGTSFSIPISNQFESLLWGVFFGTVVAVAVVLWSRSWNSIAGLVGVSIMGVLLMGLAYFKPIGVGTDLTPENPVLRAALLPFHVGSMVGGYALIAIAFGIALLYLTMWFFSGPGAEDKITLTNLDRFHNLMVRSVFLLLLVGLILGAAWGDVAWGRWWGWDPKETWAFITWLVYAIVIHVRLITKDRGAVTACMSVWGFVVMLFTWFGTNYGLTRGELHAYSGVGGDDAGNIVPQIWAGLSVLFPLAIGVSCASRSVHLARTEPDAARGRNLGIFTLFAWGLTVAVMVLLYTRYGTTPQMIFEWVAPTPGIPMEANHMLPGMAIEDAERWRPTLLLGLWVVADWAALGSTLGLLITLVARKDRRN